MNNYNRRGHDLRWLALASGLGALIIAQLNDNPTGLVRKAVASPVAAISAIDDLLAGHFDAAVSLPAPELMETIRSRSLFTEGRVTLITDAAPGDDRDIVVASSEPPVIELVGTLLSSRTEVALVVAGSNQPRRLRVGDTVSDWKVVRIKRDDLLLRLDDDFQPIPMR